MDKALSTDWGQLAHAEVAGQRHRATRQLPHRNPLPAVTNPRCPARAGPARSAHSGRRPAVAVGALADYAKFYCGQNSSKDRISLKLVLRHGAAIVYTLVMRARTIALLQELLLRRAREGRPATRCPGTAPVFGSFRLLCPACANPLVLRIGAKGLRYYCNCSSGPPPPDGQVYQHPDTRGCQQLLPLRSVEFSEGLPSRQQQTFSPAPPASVVA